MKIYGIDLGTTNSCISIIDNNQEIVLENDEGKKITPSVVALKNNQWLIGDAAKRQQELNSDTCISIKRLMGSNEVVSLGGRDYKPEFISAKILDYLVKNANKKMNQNIKDIVITVPAYFDDIQRNATKIAGEIAGLNVLRILNEPTAGAIAYKINDFNIKKVMAFDLGGGTFDISILEIDGKYYDVIATAGDNHLGGDDWDNLIVKEIIKYCRNTLGLNEDFLNLKTTKLRFKAAAENAKINLSQLSETEIQIPFISVDDNGPVHVNFKYSREEFENSSKDLLKKIENVFEKIINDSEIEIEEIDKVILIGGSTRMPLILKLLEKLVKKDKINHSLNVDECVSVGAAIYGNSVFNGDSKNQIALIDVISKSFGTSLIDDVYDILIPKNSSYPISISKQYTTTENFQEEIDIEILQGENVKASENQLIAKFEIKNIEYAKKGIPVIETTFKIDADGILHVSSKDLKTKSKNSVSIKNALHISEKEIKELSVEFNETQN